MLVIRRAQLDEMANGRWRDFERFAIAYCREGYSIASLEPASVEDHVRTALSRARSHGFEDAADLLGYLDLFFSIGPDFEEQPWAAEILAMTAYHPVSRLEMLRSAAVARNRSGGSRASEADITEAPDAAWPVPEAQPAPPPPVLLPADSSSITPEEFRRGRTGA